MTTHTTTTTRPTLTEWLASVADLTPEQINDRHEVTDPALLPLPTDAEVEFIAGVSAGVDRQRGYDRPSIATRRLQKIAAGTFVYVTSTSEEFYRQDAARFLAVTIARSNEASAPAAPAVRLPLLDALMP